MSVFENVELPLLFDPDVKVKDIKNKVETALRYVGLNVSLKQKAFKLSGGEQQRVAVARAVINMPSLLVADEPTAALDSGNAANLMELFKKLNDSGITIIVVTHDDVVAAHCKRIIHLEDGKIVFDKVKN